MPIGSNNPTELQFLLEENNKVTLTPLVVINPKFYRPAEVDLLLGDSSIARQELGWKPEISFDKLVELMVTSDIDEYRKAQIAAQIK